MKKTSLIFIIPLLLFSFTAPIDNPKKLSIDEITADLVNEVTKDNIGALSVTVLHHDSIIYFKSHGPINKFNKFLPDTNTIFRIGSDSKSFEAVLMLKLVEEGYFKLDDPIEKYLPEVKLLNGYSDSTKITFRQLANHTSGLARTSNHAVKEQKGPPSSWEKKTLSALPHTKFIAKPNTKMSYSNIGYAILALAMEKAANTPYIKLIEDKILVPLKMNNTSFYVTEIERGKLASGTCDCGILNHKNTRIPKRMHKGFGYNLPGGGMYSTSADLAKFVAVLMGTSAQKIISDTSLSIMQKGAMTYQDAIRRKFKDVTYGLGILVYHLDNGTTVFAHSGSVQGYWTTYAFDNKKKVAVIIMLNYDKHLDNEGTVVKILNQL